jgi:hypothetical protein
VGGIGGLVAERALCREEKSLESEEGRCNVSGVAT